ncbi:MAG TPA: hypothetical protein VHL52_03790 [Acidimicrobiia bacterium]|jgi:hypothetical protein|nr:hypothetical protein [Acidimicrobiia bacterium]
MTTPAYPEASQATSALIWSIVGLVCCGPAAIVGYIQARNELEAITAGRRDPANQGTANAARIIAIVVGVLFLIGTVIFLAFIVLGGAFFTIEDVQGF